MSEKLQNYIKPDLKNGVNSNQKSAYLVWLNVITGMGKLG
jgi:hypothetical protein|tara:strand:+ start:365 stop:484 length:120 start_codon:yes stop_codon:yes gene_type:complete